MKRSSINFAHSHTLFNLPPANKAKMGLITLLLLGLGLSASTAFFYLDLKQKQEQLNQRLFVQQKKLEKAAQDTVTAPGFISKGQAKAINTAIGQLNFPWSEILDAFQQTATSQTALLSLEPNAEKQLVRVVAESFNADAMFSYLQSLRESGAFTRVELIRYEVNEQDPKKPLRFTADVHFSIQQSIHPMAEPS